MYVYMILVFHPKQLKKLGFLSPFQAVLSRNPQLFGSADTQKAIFGAMEQIKKQMKHLAKVCHAPRFCCRWLSIYIYIYTYMDIWIYT